MASLGSTTASFKAEGIKEADAVAWTQSQVTILASFMTQNGSRSSNRWLSWQHGDLCLFPQESVVQTHPGSYQTMSQATQPTLPSQSKVEKIWMTLSASLNNSHNGPAYFVCVCVALSNRGWFTLNRSAGHLSEDAIRIDKHWHFAALLPQVNY